MTLYFPLSREIDFSKNKLDVGEKNGSMGGHRKAMNREKRKERRGCEENKPMKA
jgi:hypothetical protein